MTISSPVDRLVRRARESFVAFDDLASSEDQDCDHLQVMHADTGWHILRNGNVLARCPSLRHASRQARQAVIHTFIASRPDLLWLHAGAVCRESGSVLFVGDNGAGKSTFVVEFCRQGWEYISDDVVPIDSETGAAIPFPLTPSVRSSEASDEDSDPDRFETAKKWMHAPLSRTAGNQCPVEKIVVLEYDGSSTPLLEPLTPRDAEALLSESVLNHNVPGGAAYRMLTRLAFEKPVWKFTHPGDTASVETILEHINPIQESFAV
ncbi:MAG: hypothetical protein HKN17_01805 [Rhodothermales bacterium]|nr:hypothetical protein [Rhodothermales bacterium]